MNNPFFNDQHHQSSTGHMGDITSIPPSSSSSVATTTSAVSSLDDDSFFSMLQSMTGSINPSSNVVSNNNNHHSSMSPAATAAAAMNHQQCVLVDNIGSPTTTTTTPHSSNNHNNHNNNNKTTTFNNSPYHHHHHHHHSYINCKIEYQDHQCIVTSTNVNSVVLRSLMLSPHSFQQLCTSGVLDLETLNAIRSFAFAQQQQQEQQQQQQQQQQQEQLSHTTSRFTSMMVENSGAPTMTPPSSVVDRLTLHNSNDLLLNDEDLSDARPSLMLIDQQACEKQELTTQVQNHHHHHKNAQEQKQEMDDVLEDEEDEDEEGDEDEDVLTSSDENKQKTQSSVSGGITTTSQNNLTGSLVNSVMIQKMDRRKKIGKKRKYVKSGLYRKDRNGNFIFSSSDRARLAVIIEKPEHNQESTNGNMDDEGTPYSSSIERSPLGSAVSTSGSEVSFMNGTSHHHHHHHHEKAGTSMSASSSSCLPMLVPESFVQSPEFLLFCREQRSLLSSSLEDYSSEVVESLLIEQWKVLPAVEKSRYQTLAHGGSVQQRDHSSLNVTINSPLSSTAIPNVNSPTTTNGGSAVLLNSSSSNNNMTSGGATSSSVDNSSVTSSTSSTEVSDGQSNQRVKRPLNAYNIFCKMHFEEVKEKNPNMSINELSKLMGEKWKQMTDQDKKLYYDKVEHGQPRYKKPLNSYNLFCKKNFEALKKQYPNQSINVLSKIMGEKWKRLPAVEKQQYVERAKQISEQQSMMDLQQMNMHVAQNTNNSNNNSGSNNNNNHVAVNHHNASHLGGGVTNTSHAIAAHNIDVHHHHLHHLHHQQQQQQQQQSHHNLHLHHQHHYHPTPDANVSPLALAIPIHNSNLHPMANPNAIYSSPLTFYPPSLFNGGHHQQTHAMIQPNDDLTFNGQIQFANSVTPSTTTPVMQHQPSPQQQQQQQQQQHYNSLFASMDSSATDFFS